MAYISCFLPPPSPKFVDPLLLKVRLHRAKAFESPLTLKACLHHRAFAFVFFYIFQCGKSLHLSLVSMCDANANFWCKRALLVDVNAFYIKTYRRRQMLSLDVNGPSESNRTSVKVHELHLCLCVSITRTMDGQCLKIMTFSSFWHFTKN